MATDDILTVNPPVKDDPGIRQGILQELDVHRAVLEQAGIDDLTSVGELNLAGNILAEAHRLVLPAPGAAPPIAPVPMTAVLPAPANKVAPGYIEAGLPAETEARGLHVSVAYFVATRIVLQDNTTVVIRQPHKYVTFIAPEIVVGNNVTFTYELPLQPAASPDFGVGHLPPEPGQAPTPGHLGGVTGSGGNHGVPGGNGFEGVDAPELQVWTLSMTGSPRFLLRGQDGSPGGRGQDGGKGGRGSQGRDEEVSWPLGIKNCKKGAGAGGDGGPGGNGGYGGAGGNGGDGGRLRLHAPAEVLLRYAAGGFYVNTSGGRGGRGGEPGFPGPGGDGGKLGRHDHCAMSSGGRHDGNTGPMGAGGQRGSDGMEGNEVFDPIYLVPITKEEFELELTKPALVMADPARGREGEEITLSTLRLFKDDVLLLDGAPVPWTIHGPEAATFTVPAAQGGARTLRVQQSDGTLSNQMTFYVLPTAAQVLPDERIRPGTTATVIGSGFAPGARVRVNNEDMPDSTYVDGRTMTFTLRIPQSGPAADEHGQVAECTVLLDDGTASNPVEFVIDTLRILVIGDSVAWGQGLREHEKYAEVVEASLAQVWPGISRYTSFLAHSGATIGINDAVDLPAIHREVPTSYPTTIQQIEDYAGRADTVDHVFITAGLNDVNFRTVIDPGTRKATLFRRIDQHCRADLRDALIRAAEKFPYATVAATGYYPILSDQSADGLAEPFIAAVGLAAGGLVGAVLSTSSWSKILDNCRWFHQMSTEAIARAVDEANLHLRAPRVIFADPGFGPENAALTSQSWVYGINSDATPQDHFTYTDRMKACSAHADRVADGFQCERASAGHPNPTGASAYATAIIAELARGPQMPLDEASKAALLRRFVPILKLHPQEPNKPSTVERFFTVSKLGFHHDTGMPDCDIKGYGEVDTAAQLLGHEHATKNVLNDHGDEIISSSAPRDVVEHEGYFLELDDVHRDETMSGIEDPAQWSFYGRVMPRNASLGKMFGRNAIALQYWFFYAFNSSTKIADTVHQSHEGDWEHVTVVLENDAVKAMWLSAHNDPGRWAWAGQNLQMDGEHPIVYSAKGTHASYPTAGDQDRPFPLPKDETAEGGVCNTADVNIVVLGERATHPGGQEWLAYGGLWGELGETRWASGPQGPAFQDAWYTY